MAVLFTNEADELKIFFKIIRFRRIILSFLCDMKHLMTAIPFFQMVFD